MPPRGREGPLSGVKVVEVRIERTARCLTALLSAEFTLSFIQFAGLAPGPFAGLILSDFGSSVTRIDRFSPNISSADARDEDLLCRGKLSIAVDLKSKKGLEVVMRLVKNADVVIDPFRPGVLERMGLGPEVWLGDGRGGKGKNERLVFARLAG